MNLRSVDLNLLVVFEALMEERNVTKAAARLGVSQSAVSHALKRLRVTFGGDLLVRTPAGMEPTPQAAKLAIAFRSALAQIEDVLDVQREFNPRTSRRTFHLSVSDYVGELLLPRLCQFLRAQAPEVGLSVQHLDEMRPSDLIAYEGVEVHLSVAGHSLRPSRTQRLLEDRFVVLMHAGHPAAAQPLTLDAYLALPHLKVVGVGASVIDDWLAPLGLVRRVMIKVPTWHGMLAVIESTDLVAAIPGHWMRNPRFSAHCVGLPLPPPIEQLPLSVDAVWHPRNDEDPGHHWFRHTLKSFFVGIASDLAGANDLPLPAGAANSSRHPHR